MLFRSATRLPLRPLPEEAYRAAGGAAAELGLQFVSDIGPEFFGPGGVFGGAYFRADGPGQMLPLGVAEQGYLE